MDDPRKLSQEKIPKGMDSEKAGETRENLGNSSSAENIEDSGGLEQKLPIKEWPKKPEVLDTEKETTREQSPEKEQPEKILEKREKTGGVSTQERPEKKEDAIKGGGKDVEIKNLVKLAVRGEKEEKEVTTKARELFKKDSHSLDVFHDQLMEEKQKRPIGT